MDLLLVISISYTLGSIPFGLLFTKFFSNVDVRKIGSGNIGATNVLRTGNKILAVTTLIFDVGKGYLSVFITMVYFPELTQLSCIIVFLGHIFPIWLKFKGGKGVATFLGVLIALSIQLSLLFIFTWIVVSLIFRYSSISSMFSTFTVFIVTVIKDNTLKSIDPNIDIGNDLKLILFIFLILIIFTHRINIFNLKNKSEKKIRI